MLFFFVIFLFQFEKIPCGRARKTKNQVGLALQRNLIAVHLFFFISITIISILRLKFLKKLSILQAYSEADKQKMRKNLKKENTVNNK